jgi:hypothetical protein
MANKSTAFADTTDVDLSPVPGISDISLTQVDELAPATDVAASGALIEPEIISRIDTKHPAVDDAPRKGQPVLANRIDFNDPGKTDAETVTENLKAQA